MIRNIIVFMGLLAILISTFHCSNSKKLSHHVSITYGAVNGIFIEKNGSTLVVYGDPNQKLKKADMVLFTHSRRDVVWAGRKLVTNGAKAVVPVKETAYFTKVDSFWNAFSQARFHDYAQQTTKVLSEPLEYYRKIKGGDRLRWQNLPIRIIDTPGFTRGAVSYLIDIDSLRIAFVGDLIYSGGKIMDLYSLQDAVPEAQVGGYHGYAGRLSDLINSLKKLAKENPDILIPAHGPIIKNPELAIRQLIKKVRLVYKNYLSITGLRWYFGQKRLEILAKKVLAPSDTVEWMALAPVIQEKPPSWYLHTYNSNLILSEDSSGFLIDCGMQGVKDNLEKWKRSGRLAQLDGLFITHYHDDHTEKINEIVSEFKCPVYVCEELRDIIEHPEAYRLPAMTSQKINSLTVVPDGFQMRWKEFNITFFFFPGQTLFHEAVLFEHDNGEGIFFIGDSFTPSGIDDYCLLNRNFLQKDMGYFYCLDILRNLSRDYLICNQHVKPPFQFSSEQLDHMFEVLHKRRNLLKDLFPWDDPNYGLDERWARIYPYGQKVKPGQSVNLEFKIMNHSNIRHNYRVSFNGLPKLRIRPETASLEIGPKKEDKFTFKMHITKDTTPGVYIITSNIQFGQWDLREWCESIIEVIP